MTPELLELGEVFYSTQRYYGASHRFAMSQAIMYIRRKAPELHPWDVGNALIDSIPDPALVLQGL
jgi:hypothetical protein